MSKRICVDFDGVIHSYTSSWKGAAVIPDPPVDGAIDFIRHLQLMGYEVVIHTTRASDENEADGALLAIRRWLRDNGLVDHLSIAITDRKMPAEVYIDDRALRFEGTWPTPQQLEAAAKPWNKPNRKPASSR